MARYRTIKPELFADEKLTECTVDARFLFMGMLCFVDDMGRKQYSPKRIRAEVFPADTEYTVEVVDQLIHQLVDVGVIELYDHGRDHYLRIPHFLDHQVINKPGHSTVPPAPSEGPNARCHCKGCVIKGLQRFPYRDSSGTGVVREDSGSDPVVGTAGSGIGIGIGSGKGDGVSQIHTHVHNSENSADSSPSGSNENRQKHRSSPWIEVAGIAGAILRILEIPPNSNTIKVLAQTIRIRAEVEGCSDELSANKLAGRAAVLLRESPPEVWEEWFYDARYDHVPQGDSRINSKGFMARPVCGGKLCSEGWESVTVNGSRRLRRCPDCAQLWRDQGLE